MPDAQHISLLVEENIGLLRQGIDLVEQLRPETYANNTHQYFRSGVGKHFRHVLDFYDRFFSGFEDTIDYESRRRDSRIESDLPYAVSVARTHCERLRAIPGGTRDGAQLEESASRGSGVLVRNEVLDADGAGIICNSTIERELAVLASHTVHHYAIIAMLLRVQDVEVDHSFGVAPSTLRFLAAKTT